MSNYDVPLDMETDNSNSLILRNIRPNSCVLEFGPASGRMTRFLKEQLNCEVYIVEADQELGKIAQKFAKYSWLGPELGDIENFVWLNQLQDDNIKFDYIIFADVLEHLHEPEKVLDVSRLLLKETGSIFVSIPNISHNAVIIDLLRDKFDYRDVGILDKTHLKFFTYHSLKAVIERCNLNIAQEFNAVNVVDNTEFGNSYEDLPQEISSYLKAREFGEVYQFVWELKQKLFAASIVIPVFNKWNFTKSCLDDLQHLDSTKVEIIIVNNGSSDETQDKLLEYSKKLTNLKVINNTDNLGFAKACNSGYMVASADKVLFLNNDIRVKDDRENWIWRLIEACDDNSLVGPTGGKVDPKNGFQFLYETNDPTKEINYMSGWCLLAKKTVFDKLIEDSNQFKGPFSEKYFCYFEDTHLSFSATRIGINFKLIQIPVVHFGKVSSKQLNTYELYKKSKVIFESRWK